MTPAQRARFYFPAWRRAFLANWTTVERLVRPADNRRESDTVLEVELVASMIDVIITQDVLRYACHALARRHLAAFKAGRDESDIPLQDRPIHSNNLSNAEMEAVVHLFGMLADSDDLKSVMGWLNPGGDARRRYEWFLENRCQVGYVARVCAGKFGTSDWRSLELGRLAQLVLTMKHRKNGQKHEQPEGRTQTAETAAQGLSTPQIQQNETESQPF